MSSKSTKNLALIGGLLGGVSGMAAGLGIGGYQDAQEAKEEANQAQNRSREAQEKIQSEQRANNAAKQAEARRKAYREERVRRARIMQSAENTGVEGSSGEYGALGNLETQLSTTLGNQIGGAASVDRISGYAQDNANAQFDFQNAQQRLSSASSDMNLAMSLFSTKAGVGELIPSASLKQTTHSSVSPDSNLNLLM